MIAKTGWKAPPGYLNTASFGVPCEAAVEEVTKAIQDDWVSGLLFRSWLPRAQAARSSIARLFSVPAEWVALGSSTAPLWSSVASSLPDNARVLAPKNEHNSNLIPYLNQANRGVTIEYVPLSELASKTVKGITLVTCSAASFLTGEVADIDAIREATRAVGALFCLDATQACGWLPLDGNSADIVACSVHKFLCSPIGGAFLVMRPELAARIKPVTPSWVACKDSLAPPNGTDFDLAEGARKFDTVPNLVSMVGAQRSIDLITQIGVHKIYQHNLELANRFRDGIGLPPSNSAIVTIFRPGAVEQLARANIRAMEWCGNLRVSFHYYNSEEDVNHALDVLAGPRP